MGRKCQKKAGVFSIQQKYVPDFLIVSAVFTACDRLAHTWCPSYQNRFHLSPSVNYVLMWTGANEYNK